MNSISLLVLVAAISVVARAYIVLGIAVVGGIFLFFWQRRPAYRDAIYRRQGDQPPA